MSPHRTQLQLALLTAVTGSLLLGACPAFGQLPQVRNGVENVFSGEGAPPDPEPPGPTERTGKQFESGTAFGGWQTTRISDGSGTVLAGASSATAGPAGTVQNPSFTPLNGNGDPIPSQTIQLTDVGMSRPMVVRNASFRVVSPRSVHLRAVVGATSDSQAGSFQISLNPSFANTAPVAGTVAGSGSAGDSEGFGSSAQLSYPSGIVRAFDGTLFVSDTGNQKIRKITLEGLVTTIAGSGSFGSANGDGPLASFAFPGSLALEETGEITVADTYNHSLRKIEPGGAEWEVSTFAGAGFPGFHNSTAGSAQFDTPNGVAIDNAGCHYIADTANHRIRMISPSGMVTTLAGSGTAGWLDGTGAAAQFDQPYSVALDSTGNLYVSDLGNHQIRKITPSGVVTTIAGTGNPGALDGGGSTATFSSPAGLIVTGPNIYVCDRGNDQIRQLSAPVSPATEWQVSTLGGPTLDSPASIDASSSVLYVADSGSHRVLSLALPTFAVDASLDPNSGSGEVFADLDSLIPGTTYYFRWVSPAGTPLATFQAFTTPLPTPFRRWQLENYGVHADNPAVAGPLADSDGNGLTNLEAYAQSLPASGPVTDGLPVMSIDSDQLMSTAHLTYQKSFAATDVTHQVEWSLDAVNWSSSGVNEMPLAEEGDVEIIEASIQDPGAKRLFMRLTLTLNN